MLQNARVAAFSVSELLRENQQGGNFRYIQSYNVRHIELYLPTFGYILVDSGIFRILAQLDMFIYIKAYSEPMAYSAIFRTVDIFRQFQTLLKSNSCIF